MDNSTPVPTVAQLKTIDDKIGIIHILTGKTADGEEFFAYVSVVPSKYTEFLRRVDAEESMNVEEFGKVLHKGFGVEPGQDDIKLVKERYGIEPGFTEKLLAEFDRLRKANTPFFRNSPRGNPLDRKLISRPP